MRTTARRAFAAALVGSALVLSSAASCGPTGDDDGSPGVEQNEDGDDDEDGDD